MCGEQMDVQHFYVFCSIALAIISVLGAAMTSGAVYEEKFILKIKDHRCSNASASFNMHSKSKCAVLCGRYSTCLGFNYGKSSGICEIVHGVSALDNTTPYPGFSVYKSSRVTSDYIDVGDYVVAVYADQRRYVDAVAACAPSGRLIRIETDVKFYTITNYLESRRQTDPSLQDVWMDAYLDANNSYRFSDGSMLPVFDDPSLLSISSYEACIRIGYKVGGYLLRDKECNNFFAFMCELL